MKNLEDRLQEACVKWFRYQYPYVVIFAIPNGGSRNPIEAAKLKRTGTLAGVADLFVVKSGKKISEQFDDGTYYWKDVFGLFIELKVGKKKQTVTQMDFEEYCIASGYQYSICRSIDEFMTVVNDYLK